VAADTATDDRDRAVAFYAIGDVQRAQSDRPAALTSYRASLGIRERLAKADPVLRQNVVRRQVIDLPASSGHNRRS
jgi:hypothetical protein